MREEIQVQFGHRVLCQYDDQAPEKTVFILQALDEAPKDLLDESRHAIKRNNSEFVKREKYHRVKGNLVTWKNVGAFVSLALALAAAKLRLTLMQYGEAEREVLVTSLSELAQAPPVPSPVHESELDTFKDKLANIETDKPAAKPKRKKAAPKEE